MAIKDFLLAKLSRMADFRGLWLFMLVLSVMSLYDLTGATMFSGSQAAVIVYVIVIAMMKASLITLLYVVCARKTALRIMAIAVIVVYAVLALINFTAFILYDMGISRKLITILAQTNPSEVSGFLPGMVGNICDLFRRPAVYVCIAGIAAACFAVKKCPPKVFAGICAGSCAVGVPAFAFFVCNYPSGRTAHSLFLRTAKYSVELVQWSREYGRYVNLRTVLPDADRAESTRLAGNIIVVIGESASRDHFSLYGYPLGTTQALDARRDSLFIFPDVIGSSTCTIVNMERLLSFEDDTVPFGDGENHPLLIDLFNAAGYTTYWLSNQDRTGLICHESIPMMLNSSVIEYVGADNGNDALIMKYDEALLRPFGDALCDSAANRLIFLHLLGSHSEYSHRFPPEFRRFGIDDERRTLPGRRLDEERLQRRADYDNSLLYTDSILGCIIDSVAALPEASLVVYFSDHGENVYDEDNYCGRGKKYVRVPFVIYANAAYRRRNPDIMTRIEESLARPYSTANLVHLLMTASGTIYPLYDPELDLLSPQYRVRPRYVDGEVWPYDL